MKECLIYIDGEFAESVTRERFESIDPYTREAWATVPRCNELDVTRAIESAKRAFDDGRWSRWMPSARGQVLRQIADRLSDCVDEFAILETSDNGKPIVDTVGQIGSLPEWFRYYASLAETRVDQVLPVEQGRLFCYTQQEPLGVISAIR